MTKLRFSQLEDLPIVLSVSELSQVLGIGKNTAYALVNDGTIPSVRVGRQIRISRAAVEEFLHTPQAG
jgi:DNA binding domain, excisionase family